MTELENTIPTPSVDESEQRTLPEATPSRPASVRAMLWAGGIILLLVMAGLVSWWYLPPQLHGIQLTDPRLAEDFTLPTSTGESMSLSDFRGKYVVIFFGYTFCPDVCPTTLSDLQQMLKELGASRSEEIQVLMISVDPERDTPEQLATYLAYFDPTFIGMTGTVEEIQPVASQFGVFFEAQPGSENTGYLVDHTAAVTVIDPEGYVREIFTYGVTGAEMASDIAYLMRRG